MWGYRADVVDSTVVDQFEASLLSKLETLGGFNTPVSNVLYRVFGEFDSSRTGKTNLADFERAMERMNFLNKKREIRALFRRYDIDDDGLVDYRQMGLAISRDGPPRSVPAVGRFREVLLARCGGFQALADLSRNFAAADRSRTGLLEKGDLMRGVVHMLNGFGVYLRPSDIEDLCPGFERPDGRIKFDEFIDAVRGQMNAARIALVGMAFDALDVWVVASKWDIFCRDKTGAVTVSSIAQRYDVSHHPRVRTQLLKPRDATYELLRVTDKSNEQLVSREEFLAFYRWISPNIDSDDYFEFMMRAAWHIPGISGPLPTGELRLLVSHRDGFFTVERVAADATADPAAILGQLRMSRHIDALRVDIAF